MLIDIDGAIAGIGGNSAAEDDKEADDSNTKEMSDSEVEDSNDNSQNDNEEDQDGDGETMTDGEDDGKEEQVRDATGGEFRSTAKIRGLLSTALTKMSSSRGDLSEMSNMKPDEKQGLLNNLKHLLLCLVGGCYCNIHLIFVVVFLHPRKLIIHSHPPN